MQVAVTWFCCCVADSEDYGNQLLYLQAMNNIRVGPVAEYLEPLIQGRLNYSHQLRFLAVWAALDTHVAHPDKVTLNDKAVTLNILDRKYLRNDC
jgi:hypothetical protein